LQDQLAAASTQPWTPPVDRSVAACWVSFGRGLTGRGGPGDSEWAAAVTVRAGQVGGPARAAWCRGRAYVPGLLALALAGFARPLFARCDRCRTLSCSTPLDATSLAAPGWPSTWVLRSSCPVSGEPSASARTR
jgi:hypothetical protein